MDRAWVKSLWMPVVRWVEVTEEGFSGGPVMPDTYDGSAKSNERLRGNVLRAGLVGNLVANDFKSSTIVVPLLDVDPATGKRINYGELTKSIEQPSAPSSKRRTASTRCASSDSPRSSASC